MRFVFLALAMLPLALPGQDLRYGTFGKLADANLPWREGGSHPAVVEQGADFVTVGALDW